MPRVRDVLQRFRPSGAPGAATDAGVPVDRATELAVELEPVLGLLAQTERECAELVEQARSQDAEIRGSGARQAAVVLAQGRARVQAERAAAVARSRGAHPSGTVSGGGQPGAAGPAGAAAPAPAEAGDDALAPYVALVVDAVLALLRDGAASANPLAGAR